MKNHVLYFTNPNQLKIVEEEIPKPKPDEVLIQNNISGISAGTEMLFYRGLIPNDLILDNNIVSLQHKFQYPFKYGYSSVGKIIDVGNKSLNYLRDRLVFAFNPHESYFCVNQQQVLLLPHNLTFQDALFLPNMETAINLLMDSTPLIGENVLILGLGIVGLLTTALLQQFPLSALIASDLYSKRCNIGKLLGATFTYDASQIDLDQELKNCLNRLQHNAFDLIYELTGNPDGLNLAINHANFGTRIVLGSWYGKKSCNIDLGGKFHRNRIHLISSQVSTIASQLQDRWTKQRRFEVAFNMLAKIRPARFISHKFHITDAHKAYQLLHSRPQETLQVTLTYEQ